MDEQEFFVQQPRSRTYIDFKEVQLSDENLALSQKDMKKSFHEKVA